LEGCPFLLILPERRIAHEITHFSQIYI
jgi:hypothetical protein